MSERLQIAFPGLRTTSFRVTSSTDPLYNCIAWAAGVSTDWWWPLEDERRFFWPAAVPREITLSAFILAFQTLGYSICDHDAFEPGFEKVALFADELRTPTHAARQLANAKWTSKLGQSEDIEHDLRALEGAIYGSVASLMKRPMTASENGA